MVKNKSFLKSVIPVILFLFFMSCKNDKKVEQKELEKEQKVEPKIRFGFNLDKYVVLNDTVSKGDTFGGILEENRIGYPAIFNIVNAIKPVFDVRKIRLGKPYTVLSSKDSLQAPEVIIYEHDIRNYTIINLKDSIYAYKEIKPIKYVEKEVSGIINSSLSQTLDEAGVNVNLANYMSDIYAWTINFFKLYRGDKFRLVYTDMYVDDSTYYGIHKIKAAYFEHRGEPFYAFEFETDKEKGIVDYFSESGKNLRRAFLKAPVKYSRISSRYNLKRRIALYGNRLRPHRGTDFAASVGTPIMTTANGTVIASSYTSGNGNYVKVKHNSTYTTQYLHMKRRNARVGDFVKQGDVIGWVGMTGNTSGPHVCYRFWKNGVQVDPFKQKLPDAKPMKKELLEEYLDKIKPIKQQLDNIEYIYKEGTIKPI